MRTIVSGKVNGVAFDLKEDGKTVCKESQYCNLISSYAKQALDQTQEKIKKGLHPTAALDIANELEKCKEVDIQVYKVIEYIGETAEIRFLHMLKDNSKMLFLKGRFENGSIFSVNVDLSTQVMNQNKKLDKSMSDLLQTSLELYRARFCSPSIPDRNYTVYQELKQKMPELIIEQACFYQYAFKKDVIY